MSVAAQSATNHPHGAQHPRAKLSKKAARFIIERAARRGVTPVKGERADIPQTKLAERYGITSTAIFNLLNGNTWAELHEELKAEKAKARASGKKPAAAKQAIPVGRAARKSPAAEPAPTTH